jgi:hypothetical protein
LPNSCGKITWDYNRSGITCLLRTPLCVKFTHVGSSWEPLEHQTASLPQTQSFSDSITSIQQQLESDKTCERKLFNRKETSSTQQQQQTGGGAKKTKRIVVKPHLFLD